MRAETNEYLVSFGRNLRAIRTMKGLSLEQLASRADIDIVTLIRVEEGTVDIDILTLADIADGLGMEPKDLIPKS